MSAGRSAFAKGPITTCGECIAPLPVQTEISPQCSQKAIHQPSRALACPPGGPFQTMYQRCLAYASQCVQVNALNWNFGSVCNGATFFPKICVGRIVQRG